MLSSGKRPTWSPTGGFWVDAAAVEVDDIFLLLEFWSLDCSFGSSAAEKRSDMIWLETLEVSLSTNESCWFFFGLTIALLQISLLSKRLYTSSSRLSFASGSRWESESALIAVRIYSIEALWVRPWSPGTVIVYSKHNILVHLENVFVWPFFLPFDEDFNYIFNQRRRFIWRLNT